MEDPAAELINALDVMNKVAGELTADEAVEEIDAATLQVFWREWPAVSGWAGSLWRRLNADLEGAATVPNGDEFDELGGSG